MPRKNKITLLQMDGQLAPDEVKSIIKDVLKAGQNVYKKQKEALKKKYNE